MEAALCPHSDPGLAEPTTSTSSSVRSASAPAAHELAPRKDSARDPWHRQGSTHRGSTQVSGHHCSHSPVDHKKRPERGRAPTSRLAQTESAALRPMSGYVSSALPTRVSLTPVPTRGHSSPGPQHSPIWESCELQLPSMLKAFEGAKDLIALVAPPSPPTWDKSPTWVLPRPNETLSAIQEQDCDVTPVTVPSAPVANALHQRSHRGAAPVPEFLAPVSCTDGHCPPWSSYTESL